MLTEETIPQGSGVPTAMEKPFLCAWAATTFLCQHSYGDVATLIDSLRNADRPVGNVCTLGGPVLHL